jgi:hypothetical protein
MDSDFIVDKACFERGCMGYDSREGGELVIVPMMEITLLRKDQYGKAVYYPICDKAKVFANIAGTKTLTADTVRRIKELGYKFDIQHEKDEI